MTVETLLKFKALYERNKNNAKLAKCLKALKLAGYEDKPKEKKK